MSATLRHHVGKLLIAGFEGPELTATERAWLKLIRPGGVILFRRNIETAAQTVRLLREITKIIGEPAFRCVDVEGGLVDRFRDLMGAMPSPAEVFDRGKSAQFQQHGRLIAQAARLLGFNTVFAPVLDLALPESSAVMRTRVVSPDPDQVISYAAAFLKGLSAENIIGCGKHFPGLGGAALDSHQAMPVIQRSWDKMWAEDIVPYRKLAHRLPMVMIAHASYPKASGERLPASISSFWISDVLRKKIGYKGLIVTDDMEMGGILTQCSIEEAAIESVSAGMNLLEICKDPSLILRAYEALLSEAEKSKAFHRIIWNSSRRIRTFPQARGLKPNSTTPSPESIRRLQHKIKEFQK